LLQPPEAGVRFDTKARPSQDSRKNARPVAKGARNAMADDGGTGAETRERVTSWPPRDRDAGPRPGAKRRAGLGRIEKVSPGPSASEDSPSPSRTGLLAVLKEGKKDSATQEEGMAGPTTPNSCWGTSYSHEDPRKRTETDYKFLYSDAGRKKGVPIVIQSSRQLFRENRKKKSDHSAHRRKENRSETLDIDWSGKSRVSLP